MLTPTGTTLRVTSETLTLPGSEKMGMAGGDILFDVTDHLRLGIGSYGAVRGERGGFITIGVAGEAHQRLSPSWLGHAGLFVGAGGGRDGYLLAGGGLMLRGDVGLTYQTAGYGNFGFGVSHVQFPSGTISSTQPYFQYDYPFYSLLGKGWSSPSSPDTVPAAMNGLKAQPNEFALVVRRYKIPAGVVRDDGQPQHSSMQLVGVEWLSYLDDRWFLKLESEGAMGGQSAGYMQILAGGGYRWPIARRTAVKLHAAAGPAGGGVDTGGGLLLDAGVSLEQNITKNTAIELSLTEMSAPSRSFRAQSLALKLNHQFGLPSVSSQAIPWSSLGGFEANKLRVRVANQTYFKADNPAWRNRNVDQPVSNLGVQLDYFVSPNLFLTGQGLGAYDGEAGAYMTGQVGLGAQLPVSDRWFVEGEALLGAAGGGGLTVGGGLVAQANASMGYRLSNSLSVLATAGYVGALAGDFKAKVAGLAMVYQFTAYSKR